VNGARPKGPGKDREEARNEHDTERKRAGTIYSAGAGYSYGEIHVANSLLATSAAPTNGELRRIAAPWQ
jgi:hypothetical protein